MTTQQEKLKSLIIKLCNQQERRTFSRQELLTDEVYSSVGIDAERPDQMISRLLQELRDKNFLSFGDRGHYTLKSPDFLDKEKEDLKNIIITPEENLNKREYISETYIRSTKLVRAAKKQFGGNCLLPNCKNTFLTPGGQRYIEVHHIIPLFKGGEDALWNLSVLCAHHHKMAHFAEEKTVNKLQKDLLAINRERLPNLPT